MTDLTRLPETAALDAVIAVIERDGGVIVEDFVPPAILAELKADLLPEDSKPARRAATISPASRPAG